MASYDHEASTGEIAKRLDVRENHAGNLRLSLIRRGLIDDAGYGKVDFALPYLREHLRATAPSFQKHSPTRAAFPRAADVIASTHAFDRPIERRAWQPPSIER